MAGFSVLEQTEEDKLHATRLLGIEERPLKRVTKRLLAPNTPIQAYLNRPRDPVEHDDTTNDSEAENQRFLKDLKRFHDDVLLDFAAFESSIARIQFLRAANERERERYANEKYKIEATAEEVRVNTTNLRVQLDEAQKTLAIRKTYDVLADKITSNVALKPRDEQHVNIEKLRAEIEELERESVELSQAWVDRREQFAKIVDEAARLRRIVRNEKEPEDEEEKDENEDSGDRDNQDEDMLGVGREREPASNIGTPRPIDEASTPLPTLHESGALTPRSTLPGGDAASPQPDVVKENLDVDMVEEGHPNGSMAAKQERAIEKVNDDMDMT